MSGTADEGHRVAAEMGHVPRRAQPNRGGAAWRGGVGRVWLRFFLGWFVWLILDLFDFAMCESIFYAFCFQIFFRWVQPAQVLLTCGGDLNMFNPWILEARQIMAWRDREAKEMPATQCQTQKKHGQCSNDERIIKFWQFATFFHGFTHV